MSEDEKLLMLAAKAEGRKPPIDANGVFNAWVGSAENGHWWNPLEDDGDAFRLAVKLGMGVNFSQYDAFTNVYLEGFNQRANTISERTSDPDLLAEISRRAIVRAAAEIGKATA